ncbi:MAG: YdeI/OmpD-associated family protein [Bacteroidales bacterium]|nr:YdeI/OmpD-associated family protein [Bacteroidales bacterium]
MPDNPSILYCTSRKEWRDWLSLHFESEKEIWLAFSLKASGEESISYNDAVEEALCFGWIDSVTGSLDSKHQLRRFTPRRKGRPYSRPNIERLIWLDTHGMIHPKIRESVAGLINEPYVFPEDILVKLKEDETVWLNYTSFPEPYRRIRVASIDAARKRPAEFEKRLAHFIRSTRQNKLIIGYGGVDKYY